MGPLLFAQAVNDDFFLHDGSICGILVAVDARLRGFSPALMDRGLDLKCEIILVGLFAEMGLSTSPLSLSRSLPLPFTTDFARIDFTLASHASSRVDCQFFCWTKFV